MRFTAAELAALPKAELALPSPLRDQLVAATLTVLQRFRLTANLRPATT